MRTLAVVLCVLVLASPVGASPIRGWLRTSGRQIVDASGQPVVFQGVNSSGLEFGNGSPLAPGRHDYSGWLGHSDEEYANISRWGFNMVRLPISWANLEPEAPRGGAHRYNAAYLAAIDESVRLAGRHGLPVVLSMHQNEWSRAVHYTAPNGRQGQGAGMPAWLYPDAQSRRDAERRLFEDRDAGQQSLIAAWTMLAARYSHDPTVVGIDVYNEPQRQATEPERQAASTALAAFHARAAEALRRTNPRLLVVLQDFADHDPRLPRVPGGGNVVYSFHCYQPWSGLGRRVVTAHVARGDSLGVPTWLGEFGRWSVPDWQTELRDLLTSLRQGHVSWTVWAYQRYRFPLYGMNGEGPADEEQLRVLRGGL